MFLGLIYYINDALNNPLLVRYLYWSDWGDNPHIGRIGMDGTNRSVIVEDKITWPNGLTLDFINDRIYWADAREDYIEFASLDGTNRHTGTDKIHVILLLLHRWIFFSLYLPLRRDFIYVCLIQDILTGFVLCSWWL